MNEEIESILPVLQNTTPWTTGKTRNAHGNLMIHDKHGNWVCSCANDAYALLIVASVNTLAETQAMQVGPPEA